MKTFNIKSKKFGYEGKLTIEGDTFKVEMPTGVAEFPNEDEYNKFHIHNEIELSKEDQEVLMYGMTEAELKAEPIFKEDNILGDCMYAMSILSDAQHVLKHMDDKETARQFMNKAKYWIGQAMERERKKSA